MTKPDQSPDDRDERSQAEKFADLARELECDESEEGFDERLRRMAKAPMASGTCDVQWSKVGEGYTLSFTPDAYGAPRSVSDFHSQEDAYRWLSERGWRQLEGNPDRWIKEA